MPKPASTAKIAKGYLSNPKVIIDLNGAVKSIWLIMPDILSSIIEQVVGYNVFGLIFYLC